MVVGLPDTREIGKGRKTQPFTIVIRMHVGQVELAKLNNSCRRACKPDIVSEYRIIHLLVGATSWSRPGGCSYRRWRDDTTN